MSFELAAVIVLALVAVALGLVCYHLLGRLEMLENSVQGGLQPPTSRLSREQFERRFRTAHARSALARDRETGVLLIVGPEHDGSDLAATVEHLARRDHLTITRVETLDAHALGITTTPYLIVIDDKKVRAAQPAAGPTDVIAALKQFT